MRPEWIAGSRTSPPPPPPPAFPPCVLASCASRSDTARRRPFPAPAAPATPAAPPPVLLVRPARTEPSRDGAADDAALTRSSLTAITCVGVRSPPCAEPSPPPLRPDTPAETARCDESAEMGESTGETPSAAAAAAAGAVARSAGSAPLSDTRVGMSAAPPLPLVGRTYRGGPRTEVRTLMLLRSIGLSFGGSGRRSFCTYWLRASSAAILGCL
eukprot:365121-Chlamydomonas_euryale.AAC.2